MLGPFGLEGAKVLVIIDAVVRTLALHSANPTVRRTFRMIKIMAERYGVPEFKTEFNSGEQLHKHVSNRFGMKEDFGFVYHREGEHQRPEEATQLVIPPYREGYEAHLFGTGYRSIPYLHGDTHGATVKYNTRVKNVETDDKGVTIYMRGEQPIRAKSYIAS